MKSEDQELLFHIKQYIETIESQLKIVKQLIEIGLAEDDNEILPDAKESVQEEEEIKLPAKPTLTKEQKRLKLAEARARAQLWAEDLKLKKKERKPKK